MNIFLRAFATFPEFLKYLTGNPNVWDVPINTYGSFVAMGFMVAAIVTYKGLKDRGKVGLLKGFEREELKGEKPKASDLLSAFAMWFIIGYKFIGAIANDPSLLTNGQRSVAYILSLEGFWFYGLLLGAVGAGITYYRLNKKALPEPVKETVKVEPQDLVGEMVGVAALFGVVGASVFEIIQPNSEMTLKELFSDPMNFLSGLTILGGLTFGIIGIFIYAWYRKLKPFQLFDAIAPGYILAYGMGRLGCHFSGDGDWGKVNLLDKPSFLPEGLWSNRYAHNVINRGELIPGCEGNFCHILPEGVWPTSIYETAMCVLMFLILWSVRKKFMFVPGFVFAFLMVLNGIERYLIEIIRVTDRYPAFFNLSQAQIISIFMIIAGVTGMIFLARKYKEEIKASSFTKLNLPDSKG